MRTFVHKQKPTQQTKSSKSARSGRAISAQSREVRAILHLQRTIGNHALQRLLQSNAEGRYAESLTPASTRFGHDFSRIPIFSPPPVQVQPKLTVSAPGDRYEQEADRVADQVMSMPDLQVNESTELPTQRQAVEEDNLIRAKSIPGQTQHISSSLAVRIERLRGGGQSLPSSMRAFFESRFGHDFSGVRVHTASHANETAEALNAHAFTLGRDIVFGARQYAPATSEGRRLLAHELTHVVQQTENSLVQRKPREARILKTSRDYKIPPGTSGCYLHLLLLIDAGRNVPRLTTAGEVAKYRKYKKITRGATVSDLVAVLKKKGIAKRSRWFSYPKAGRSFKTFKKLNLRGDPEGFVMSRVRTGQPAYFAVSFRNIHSGFILVTSDRKVLWLDQIYRGGKDVTGKLNKFLSRFLDDYVERNRKLHAWYGSTKITELRF